MKSCKPLIKCHCSCFHRPSPDLCRLSHCTSWLCKDWGDEKEPDLRLRLWAGVSPFWSSHAFHDTVLLPWCYINFVQLLLKSWNIIHLVNDSSSDSHTTSQHWLLHHGHRHHAATPETAAKRQKTYNKVGALLPNTVTSEINMIHTLCSLYVDTGWRHQSLLLLWWG